MHACVQAENIRIHNDWISFLDMQQNQIQFDAYIIHITIHFDRSLHRFTFIGNSTEQLNRYMYSTLQIIQYAIHSVQLKMNWLLIYLDMMLIYCLHAWYLIIILNYHHNVKYHNMTVCRIHSMQQSFLSKQKSTLHWTYVYWIGQEKSINSNEIKIKINTINISLF